MKSMEMKSIKTKIFVNITAIVLAVVILIGGVSAYLNYKATFDTLEQTMKDLSVVSSEVVTQKLEVYKTITADIGLMSRLSSTLTSKEEKADIYNQRMEMYNLSDIYTVNTKGIAVSNSTGKLNKVGDTDYFKASMNGENFITDPQISSETGDLVVIVSAPLWKGGVYGSTIDGVLVVENQFLKLTNMME